MGKPSLWSFQVSLLTGVSGSDDGHNLLNLNDVYPSYIGPPVVYPHHHCGFRLHFFVKCCLRRLCNTLNQSDCSALGKQAND